jgi:O-antigen/teichoic acid export membrane protein
LLAGTGAAAVLSYAAVTISARLLGPDAFGLLGALVAVTSLATVALTWVYAMAAHIASTALARHEPDSLRRLSGPVLVGAGVFGLLILVVTLALSGPIATFLHSENPWILGLLAPLLAAIACGQILKGFLSGLQRFRAFSAATALEALTRAILTAPLVLAFGVAGSLGAYVGGVLVADTWVVSRLGAIGWRLPSASDLVGPGWTAVGTAITTVMVGLLQYSDLILLRWYAPADEAGIYSATAALGNTLFTLAVPLTLPAFPRALAAYDAHEPTWPILLRALVPVVVGGLAAILVSAWLGELVAVAIFGLPFAAVGTLLPVYFAKTTGLIVLALVGQHAVAVRRPGALFVAAAVSVTGPVLIATLTPSVRGTALISFAVAIVATSLLALLLAISTLAGERRRTT